LVNYQSQSNVDAALAALADPVRRALVECLSNGELPVGRLAAPHAISLPAVMKHLGVLERAGLVQSEKRGRVRFCRLKPQPLCDVNDWLERQLCLWNERFDRLDETLREMQANEEETE
jgi:DNA-binding transcriptional ArsR family regulator